MSDTYKTSLIIVDDRGRVAARQQPAGLFLPEVEVEPGRVGISLSRAIREQLHLETFCLVLSETSSSSYHTLRLQRSNMELPAAYAWADPTELSDSKTVENVLAHFSPADTEFARFAWYTEVLVWLDAEIAKLGYTCRGLEQWNGRVGGVLLRVLTDGPDFWFKAVSDFNAREFWIAQLLSERHPGYFPKVLAAQPRWNAFLLGNVSGEELNDCENLEIWKEVAELLADVQADWIGESTRLLEAGAADLRSSVLLEKIPVFLEQVAQVMARQEKSVPAPLSRGDLTRLGEQLGELCTEISKFTFSEGLANADFSPHNTILTTKGPVFIDWAETCVSFPLIVGEYMWNRMVIEVPNRKQWQDALREAYLKRWAQHYGSSAVESAAQLVPAFAIFALLTFLHEREGNGPSRYDPYLRSLARRLKQEVNHLQPLSCLKAS
jgi:hypothetical protein